MAKKILKKVLSKNSKKQVLVSKQDVVDNKKIVVSEEKVKVKEDKKYNLTVGIKDLFDAGCHLGHKISKTHPKARENIYVAKDGIEIFDLQKTINALSKACNYVYNAKRNGKQILMLGTKRQAKEVVKRVATDAGVPYVVDRWLGGTITNWDQIKKNIKRLIELKDGLENGKFVDNTKKEILAMKKEVLRLERIIGGLQKLDKLFDLIIIVDAGFERTAIKEAVLRKIKTISITDSDTNPNMVDFAIPCNDDNTKSINIIVEELGKAIKSA
jgi:small subunit ribosomal protein S2